MTQRIIPTTKEHRLINDSKMFAIPGLTWKEIQELLSIQRIALRDFEEGSTKLISWWDSMLSTMSTYFAKLESTQRESVGGIANAIANGVV